MAEVGLVRRVQVIRNKGTSSEERIQTKAEYLIGEQRWLFTFNVIVGDWVITDTRKQGKPVEVIQVEFAEKGRVKAKLAE